MNGNAKIVLAVFALIAGPLTVWNALSTEQARQKQRLDTIDEQRREERKDIKERLQRVDERGEQTAKDINTILRKIEVMEVERKREREERRNAAR